MSEQQELQKTQNNPQADPSSLFSQILPFKHGLAHQIITNRHDLGVGRWIQNFGEFSEAEVDVFKAILKPDDVILEVGANIGAHTIALSELVPQGGIMAFEPQRLLYYTLCANLTLNSVVNVHAVQMACGSRDGSAKIPTPSPYHDCSYGSIGLKDIPEGAGTDEVQMKAIDSLGVQKLDLLKIDVEGFEVEVLKGAKATLERCRPWVYLEFESNRAEILEFLKEINYFPVRHLPPVSRVPNFLNTPAYPHLIISDMLLAKHPRRPMNPEMATEEWARSFGFFEATTQELMNGREDLSGSN